MTALAPFVDALVDAHRTGRRFAPSGAVPRDAEDAYAVQRAVMERIGPPAAWKVARKPGTAPIMAPIARAQVHGTGATVAFGRPVGVELEVALEAVARIPKGTPADRLAALVRPRPAIELVDARVEGPLAEDPFVKLADQQACGALVLGPPAPWDGADLGTVAARLLCGGEAVLDGAATVPGGSALGALAALLELSEDGLRAGEVVITGSLNGLPRFGPGTAVRGEIDGLGTVAAEIA